jgi:hypothetical protein
LTTRLIVAFVEMRISKVVIYVCAAGGLSSLGNERLLPLPSSDGHRVPLSSHLRGASVSATTRAYPPFFLKKKNFLPFEQNILERIRHRRDP